MSIYLNRTCGFSIIIYQLQLEKCLKLLTKKTYAGHQFQQKGRKLHFPHVSGLPWSKLSSPQFTLQVRENPSPEWKRMWGMTKKSLSCRFQPLWKIWIIMGPSSPNRSRNSQNKLYPLAFEIQNRSNIRIFCLLTVQGNDTAHAMVHTISPCYSDMWLTRCANLEVPIQVSRNMSTCSNNVWQVWNKSGYCCWSFLDVFSIQLHRHQPRPLLT